MLQPLKKIASQTAVYGISSIIGRFINYLLFPLHVSIFTRAEYGAVTELYSIVTLLAVLLTYGMETAYFKFSSEEGKRNSVFNTSFTSITITTLLFLILGLLFSSSAASALKYSGQEEFIIYFVIIIALDTLSALPFARLRQENKAKRFAFIKLGNIGLNVILNLIVLLVLPKVINGFVPTIGHVFFINLIASAFTLIMLFPQIKSVKWSIDNKLLKEILSFSIPLMIAGLAGMINETFDRISMKYLLPESSETQSQLGLYGGCYKVAMLMSIFIQAYRFAAEPYFFNATRDKENLKLYARSTEVFIAICAVIYLAIMLNLELVFDLFLNENYIEGMSLVPILMYANMFLGIYINVSMWYKLSGRTRFGIYFSFFGAAVTIIALFLLIPKIGIYGGAWATLICYGLMALLTFIVGQKQYPIPYSLKKIAFYLLLCPVVYYLSTLWSGLSVAPKMLINAALLAIIIVLIFNIERKTLLKHAS